MAGDSVANARDFILIGEFCQVDGPRAVVTIPSSFSKTNNNEQFNLDEFLLYIMTTDYQNFSGEKWVESADVCCIRTNILPGSHAILHYFTLKDPKARGGVRPSCIAYITQDSTKLYRLRKDLIKAISISAQIFKHANMRWMANHSQPECVEVNQLIVDLLDSCNYTHQPEAIEQVDEASSKLEPWTRICSRGVPVVALGLLKLYKFCARPLEAHIMDQKKFACNYELFRAPSPYEDAELKNLMIQLYSNV